MNRMETAQVFGVLASAYPNFKIDDRMVEVWHELLSDLDGNLVKSAVKVWAMTEKWPPTIADIRLTAAEKSGSLPPSAEEAWAEVMGVIRIYGSNQRRPEWSHPAIEQAVNSIGYRQICVSEKPDVVRAHFTKAYEGYRVRNNRTVLASPALSAGSDRKIELNAALKQLDASAT